jgi:hypothetical protein
MSNYPTTDLPCDNAPFWDLVVEETVLHSSHREWVENQEREQQRRDEQFVARFLAGKLRQKGR